MNKKRDRVASADGDVQVVEADELAQRRFLNREKQRKCRARKKEAQESFEASKRAVEGALQAEKQRLATLQKRALVHRCRIREAVAELAACAAELAGGPPGDCAMDDAQRDAAQSSGPHHDAPPPRAKGPARSVDLHAARAVADAAVRRGSSGWPAPVPARPQACSLHQPSAQAPRSFRHALPISRERIGCNGVGLEVRIDAFRAEAARQLGVDADDVLWLIESDRHPAVTRDGGVRGIIDTPRCTAKAVTLWLASWLETGMLSRMAERMEGELARPRAPQTDYAFAVSPSGLCDVYDPRSTSSFLSDVFAFPRDEASASIGFLPLPATGDFGAREPPHQQPRGASRREFLACKVDVDALLMPSQSAASEFSTQDLLPSVPFGMASEESPSPPHPDVDSIADSMQHVFLTDSAIKPAGQVGGLSGAEWETVEGAQAVAYHVFSGIVRSFIPRMHPADVVKVASRFRDLFDLRRGPSPARMRGPLTSGTAYACAVQIAHEVLHEACVLVRNNPVVPPPPRSTHEARDRLDALCKEACDAKLEFMLLYYVISCDRPEFMLRIDRSFLTHDRTSGRMQAAELLCYKRLELHAVQKRELQRLLKDHRQRVARLNAEHNSCLLQLDRLLSAADFALADLAALQAPRAPAPPPPPRFASAFLQGVEPAGASAPPGSSLWTADGFLQRSVDELRFGAPGRLSARQLLLGASGDVTAEAAHVHASLRALLAHRQHLRLRMNCAIRDTLTWRQHLVFWGDLTRAMDQYRMCEMAAADVRCEGMYGRAAICDR